MSVIVPNFTGEIVPLYQELQAAVSDRDLSPVGFSVLVLKAMRLVERLKQKPGFEKKDIAIHMIRAIIEESSASDEAKNQLHFLVDKVLPDLINIIIEVDHAAYFHKAKGFTKKLCCSSEK